MDKIEDFFEDLKSLQAGKPMPPVSQWHPSQEGTIDIRIDREGLWYHEGRQIKRHAIARVFSSILRYEQGAYFLVTPVEKLKIQVEDVPFIGTHTETRGEGVDLDVIVSTNMDDHVVLSDSHPLEMRGDVPYARVRGDLYARLSRSCYYRLVDQGLEEEGAWCIYSGGARFVMGYT